MSKNLYIAAMEPRAGKSVVALGIMELLSRRLHKIGFFRPIIPDVAQDNNIQLILNRYSLNLPYENMYAYRHGDAQHMAASGQYNALLKNILDKYKALEGQCDFVLCEGTDYTGVASAFEFDFNADVANNLGCPILAVVNGRGKTPQEISEAVRFARESFESHGCTVLSTIANRAAPVGLSALSELFKTEAVAGESVYALPEEPLLGNPTVGDVATALKSQILQGDPDRLNRDVLDIKIAAMNLPHFLDHIVDDTLVITPGDRSDIILGSLAAAISDTYPNISGLLLSGGMALEPQVRRLIEGSKKLAPIPILSVKTDTYATALNAGAVRAALTARNDRKIAAALGLFESHVNISEIEDRIAVARSRRVTPIMFEYELIERAKANRQHIVLPEGQEARILRAGEILLRRQVVDITLLGNPQEIRQKISSLGLNLAGANIIEPLKSELTRHYSDTYYEMRKHKGISAEMARDTMTDVSYFGTMMVHMGAANGMVSGTIHTTGDTIRPALQIIRTRPECSIVSSVFLMCLADRVLVYGDCAVNPDPSAEQLADIAISSAETAQTYGIEPRVAMCSYSTGESGKGADVDKVRAATRLARDRHPELKIEGPIQYDAAVDAGVARTKLPDSEVAGRATVFIFPDLNTGNNLYKAVQRSANAVAIGPILQGLNKPVNDLSRGATIPDIINTVAITAIQSQAAGT
ncbi:BioD-like N-terminal domain / Phosphate acetyltransferase (EC [Olavius sp. associated proteobacterium Delta 1]|nr:BioD-like N-terminal domain / Phosphate acetyltransferase (EC [Olavius sp. associated proteobacterium Delta 1]